MCSGSEGKQDFMSLKDAVSGIQEDSTEGIVLFIGAGVSYGAPSNSPTWVTLINMALDSACRAYPSLDCYRGKMQEIWAKVRPELVCQILYSNLLDGFWGFLDVLQMGQPNLNHESILKFNDRIKLILTTNFESYIENSFDRRNKPYQLHICSCSKKLLKNLTCQITTPIVKMHGSLDERTSIMLTLRQSSRKLNDRLSLLMKAALENYTVLVVGYSGNDDDIFPVFMEHLKQTEQLADKSNVKKIYWALWDDKSLAPDILESLRRYSACRLIDTKKEDILRRVFGDEGQVCAFDNSVKERQTAFLNKWASASSESSWMNFFFELLFVMGYHGIKKDCINALDAVMKNETNEFTIAKYLKNRADALICLEEYAGAQKSLSDAAFLYMRLGHHKEAIECLSIMIIKIPLEPKQKDIDPLAVMANISGKSFSHYALGLYNYTAGVYYLRKNRLQLGESHLMKAAGYAKRCGDQIMQLHCMQELTTLYNASDNKARADECSREAARLENRIGAISTGCLSSDDKILKDCVLASQKDMRKLIIGEGIVVAAISVFIGGIACLYIKTAEMKIITFASTFLLGAAVKFWNAIKASLLYNKIDRW